MPHVRYTSCGVLIVPLSALWGPGLALQLLGADHRRLTCETARFENHNKLHGLQVIRSNEQRTPLNFSNFDHGSAYEGLYVNQENRFAFCLIEKNGCSEWSAVIAKLRNNDPNINDVHYGIAQLNWNEEVTAKVFNDSGAVRAVFVRDPLERFLSAYLNKCFAGGCTSSFCFMRNTNTIGTPVFFSRAVEWLNEVNISKIDGHFRAQSHHCELNRRLREYTHLGLYNPETFAHESRCVMETAGLQRFDTRGTNSTEPFWNSHHGDGHDNQFSPTSEYLKRFYTRAAAEQVYRIFQEDYELFNLPKPNWIEDATGEFFNHVPKDACKQEDSNFASKNDAVLGRKDMDEISDISTLASLIGYSLDTTGGSKSSNPS